MMSALKMYGRPYVYFDVENIEHRRWFAEFMSTGGWGKCPVRFVIEDQGCSDFVAVMQRKVIEYYIKQEFKA